ncbi:ABC transporter permease [Natronomonas halophila]|uniref:ABC transporter permease n=1 Tax=Natronomonas halophila TaxID=2747817 RepID=UPI0015B52821|nr:ABC transporter permease [Natronomonas halophila]QLD87039.1 ABC transporter permease [Natronomonas halophila]
MRKLRPAIGIALAQLRHRWVRATLGIIGVAVAVLATILLLSLGFSVLDIGGAGFTRIGGDLWVTAGSVTFAPGTVGGIDANILGAHDVAADIERTDGVKDARALSFQSVYVGTEPGDYETIVGAGITGDGSAFQTTRGQTFQTTDTHYANGSYNGQMTNEVLLDKRAAEQLGVEVGDTIHVGGTLAAADNNEFTVVGISNDVARYLGTPTVMLHLSELQEVSGTTGTDPAATVLVTVEDGADETAVQTDLQDAYPEYEVRTNQEQFESVLRSQSALLASAFTIVVLAILGGIALVSNVLGLFVYQQREALAALRAVGVSTGLLLRVVVAQGLTIATLGAALGIATAAPAVRGLNRVVVSVTGLEFISMPSWTAAVGGGIALALGLVGALVAGLLVARVSPLEHLSR